MYKEEPKETTLNGLFHSSETCLSSIIFGCISYIFLCCPLLSVSKTFTILGASRYHLLLSYTSLIISLLWFTLPNIHSPLQVYKDIFEMKILSSPPTKILTKSFHCYVYNRESSLNGWKALFVSPLPSSLISFSAWALECHDSSHQVLQTWPVFPLSAMFSSQPLCLGNSDSPYRSQIK